MRTVESIRTQPHPTQDLTVTSASSASTRRPAAPRSALGDSFAPLRVRNYRLYFVSQILTNTFGWSARVAQDFHINAATLDSLDFHAVSFPSGVGAAPTIVAAFIDPEADNPASLNVRTTHLLLIANRDSAGAYVPTFIHRVNGALADAEFRRFVDHLDLTGDGVDEIVLEGWRFGGAASLTILGWRDGKWVTVYRTRPTWCLDERPSE